MESMDGVHSRRQTHCMTLEDEHLKRIDPEFGINRANDGCRFLFKAMLIRHSETKRTIALYHCAHIASTIGRVS